MYRLKNGVCSKTECSPSRQWQWCWDSMEISSVKQYFIAYCNKSLLRLALIFSTKLYEITDVPYGVFCLRNSSKCRIRLSADAVGCDSCNQLISILPSLPPVGLIPPEVTYDIRIALSDHTGTVSNGILAGAVAEKTLGVTVEHQRFCFKTFKGIIITSSSSKCYYC